MTLFKEFYRTGTLRAAIETGWVFIGFVQGAVPSQDPAVCI